jgi:hypothetical protein
MRQEFKNALLQVALFFASYYARNLIVTDFFTSHLLSMDRKSSSISVIPSAFSFRQMLCIVQLKTRYMELSSLSSEIIFLQH